MWIDPLDSDRARCCQDCGAKDVQLEYHRDADGTYALCADQSACEGRIIDEELMRRLEHPAV